MFRKRLVVCTTAAAAEPNLLPPGEFVERPWISGGERELHELAFAAAQAGREVELRGWLDRRLFDELVASTDARVAGRVTVPGLARRPTNEDVVAAPDDHDDPLHYLRVWLSDAQLVLVVMAPIGMFGWPFVAGWARRPAPEVTLAEVNRPESFRAIAAMGIPIWAKSPVIVDLARAAGGEVSFVGNGQPTAFPSPPREKVIDVAWLEDNRWAPRAREVAGKLDCTVDAIGVVEHGEMLARLGNARIMAYPCGLEGEPRITREARALGAVPVALSGNPMAEHMTERDGVLPVESVEEMPKAIEDLLADRDRLATLSARAVETARAEAAWDPFVARVAAALDELPDRDPAAGARAAMGARLAEHAAAAQERIAALDAVLLSRSQELDRHAREIARLYAQLEELHATRAWRALTRYRRVKQRLQRP